MLKPIYINNLKIDTPVLLCPMAGITDFPFRQMVSSFGANVIYSEMLSSNAIARNSKKTLSMAKLDSNSKIINAIQIAGSDMDVLKTAVEVCENLGAKMIDINMGCPVKKVVKGIAGSALMKEPKLVENIVKNLVKFTNVPITVKMRLGWDETSKNVVEIAKIAEDQGASMITVHGRTRAEFFSGNANWAAIKDVKNAVNVPVIVNGDITNEETAVKALKESKADGIMIGRGIYGKPWLINQVSHFLTTGEKLKDPSLQEKGMALLKHYDLMLEHYGEKAGMKVARKHISWYTKGLYDSASLRANVNQLTDIHKVKSIIKNAFDL